MLKKTYTGSSLRLLITILALPGLLMLSSCKKNSQHPGYVYLPDMDDSRAYETWSENPVFEDGKSLREPVEGTIPRGFEPYPYVFDDADLIKAGKALINPLEYTQENLERGKVAYERYCIHCHGEQGDGNGILFTSGRYLRQPGNLTSDTTINRPDGQIFHIMTVGYGIMGAHGSQITRADRWKILMYIRKEFQGK